MTTSKTVYWLIAFLGFILSAPLMTSEVAADQRELLVSAAISLKEAFEEIALHFEKQYLIKVNFNFGASGTLQKQIEYGAPVDVYASAAEKQMDILESRSLIIKETRRDFARNVMVIIRPKSSRIALSNIDDLTNPGIKAVAIGNPDTVPAGAYAKDILENLGLWEKLRPKLIYAQNVQHVLVYTKRGEVDAGFVYRSDIHRVKEKIAHSINIPIDSQPRILYPIAVIRNSSARTMAKRFIELVTSEFGRQILLKKGFEMP